MAGHVKHSYIWGVENINKISMAFKKGESGNPTGKPEGIKNKNSYDVRVLIDKHGDMGTVIKALYQMALSGDARAAKILMQYYFGNPTQTIDFAGNSFVLTVNSQSDTTKKILQGNE